MDNIGKESMKAGHHYMYKDMLPIGFLGLVDDIVGISEAGFKAKQLNAFINQKTAEKNRCNLVLLSANQCWFVRTVLVLWSVT